MKAPRRKTSSKKTSSSKAKAKAPPSKRSEKQRKRTKREHEKLIRKERLSRADAAKQRKAVRAIERKLRSEAARRGWETRKRKAKGKKPAKAQKPKRARKLSERKIRELARKARERQRRQAAREERERRAKAGKRPPRKPAKPGKLTRREKDAEKRRASRALREEGDLVLSYFRDVLHSTCGRMRDEGLVCTVRVHRESDGSISGEIVIPVPPPGTKEHDVRLLLITVEELDGWSANPAPGKCWVTIMFRVDARGAQDQKYPVKIAPGRATYNVATNYHHLENAAYAFQIARDDILPGLLEAGRAIIAVVMRVRYTPDGEHPTRMRK